MKISLRDLATTADAQISFDYNIDLRKEEVAFHFPFQQPVEAVGVVCDKAGVITLEATLYAQIDTACARCNVPVFYDKEVEVSFILAKSIANEQTDDIIDDIIVVETDEIELDDIFVTELLLDMELAVLCKEDCAGLCQTCGKNRNDGDCACAKRQIDPRLAKLAQLLEDTK